MPERLDVDLEKLMTDVDAMARLARGMLVDSVKALKELDAGLANDVMSRKKALYDLDDIIEDLALKMLTLYSPMASDLRKIATVFKMITYLNRIGRYGYDIAKITTHLIGQPHVKRLIHIPLMAEKVDCMIEEVITAFRTRDLTSIKDLAKRDSEVDQMRYAIFRECLTYMMEDPKTITRCTDYIMVARYLERCGDHACKIGEKVHYMVTGERIELN
ncbi:MAG: phosphate signaling complex protein PhoU [Candidatus Thermoplasmatota archaeon]|jgi:phosphate transport system protein|nr:phosphate signaling complex protein PhoU [Candidatus Thermoplasmatota archaeon]